VSLVTGIWFVEAWLERLVGRALVLVLVLARDGRRRRVLGEAGRLVGATLRGLERLGGTLRAGAVGLVAVGTRAGPGVWPCWRWDLARRVAGTVVQSLASTVGDGTLRGGA
jgi:hypothetical protein